MKIRSLTIIPVLVLMFASGPLPAADHNFAGSARYRTSEIPAGERMIAGSKRDGDLIATGARDTVTAPARLFNEIGQEAKDFGPVGLVTGSVRGGIKAGGQALKGGARMLIGVLDIVTSPFGRID